MANESQYDNSYYFDKSGMSVHESELKNLDPACCPVVEVCCRLPLPKGYKFSDAAPGMCFDICGLTCIKTPVQQCVKIKGCDHRHPLDCMVVVGYEIRVIGDVQFAVSAPICPCKGYSFPAPAHTCCRMSAPVNKVVSYSCSPDPCPPDTCCVDWNYAYCHIKKREDCCGCYLEVKIGITLEYNGGCECDGDE